MKHLFVFLRGYSGFFCTLSEFLRVDRNLECDRENMQKIANKPIKSLFFA